jgi:hypothetical protein
VRHSVNSHLIWFPLRDIQILTHATASSDTTDCDREHESVEPPWLRTIAQVSARVIKAAPESAPSRHGPKCETRVEVDYYNSNDQWTNVFVSERLTDALLCDRVRFDDFSLQPPYRGALI